MTMPGHLFERVVTESIDEPEEVLRRMAPDPLEPAMVPVGSRSDEIIEGAESIREALLSDLERFPPSFRRILRDEIIADTAPRYAAKFLRDLEYRRAIGSGYEIGNGLWSTKGALLHALMMLKQSAAAHKLRARTIPGRKRRPLDLQRRKRKLIYLLWQYGLFRVPIDSVVKEARKRCASREKELRAQMDENRDLLTEITERLEQGTYLKGHGPQRRVGDKFSIGTRLNFLSRRERARKMARLARERLERLRTIRDPIARYCAAP